MEKTKQRHSKKMNKIVILIFCGLLSTIGFAQNLANFTQVGPVKFPDNPSVQTTGMGRVSQLVYHPKDSNIMFAVTSSGGVFKSSNEGASWRPISDFLPQTYCASLAINPQNPKVMYLGTGDANYDVNYYRGGMGVWKTLNGGNSWFQSSYGIGNKLVSYILMTPGDSTTLIAACSDGIYKSTDAGASWTKKTTVNVSYRDLKYQPQSNRIIYSATNTNFFRSYDNGTSWIQSTVNSSITCAGIKIAVCPKDTSKLFCLVWKNGATSPFGGVYKSTNNGTTFSLQVDTPNILGYSSNGTSMDGQGSYNLDIASDPSNSNTLYFAGINIWKSTNQGVSFTLKSHWGYGVHADKHGFLFSPFNPNKLFVYHDGGIDRSTDGGTTWTTLEDGLSASEFYQLGNSGLYNDYVIGGLQDNGMDVATDKKFQTVRGGDWGGDFAFDAFNSQLLYENGGIKRNIVTNATGNIHGKGGIYSVHPNDSNVMFEATTDIFRTKNLRAIPDTNVAWTKISSFSGTTKQVDMAYSKFSKGTFYAAFTPQFLYRSVDINATTPSFTKITTFPFKSGEEIKQLETCDYDSNILYVLTNQSRILKSKDKGATWTSLNKNLPTSTIIKFLLDQKAGDSSMYVCNAFGVYYRNKLMNNWISFSQGLPTITQITDMEIMCDGTSKSRLHISTWGRGIWQTDLYKSTTVPPVAYFEVQQSSTQSCVNTVILVDNSIFSPTSRKWQISPSKGWNYINGTDSSSTRAEIQFITAGPYFISLFVANSKGSDIKIINYNYSSLSTAATCTTTTTLLGGYGIGIYQFELNTINNPSGAGSYSYEDFSCKGNTFLKASTSYTAWVTSGTYNNENAKIYIDYNNNGVFTDANELVGTMASGKGRRSCTFTTLATPPVLNKFIRLRVVSDFNNVTAPCGTLGYGQSEDYAIYLDKVKPYVNINIPKPTVSSSFTATFKTSEVVNGFDSKDITVSNATISNFIQNDASTFTAKISPLYNGLVKINILGNGFTDVAGNLNSPTSDSTQFFLGIKSFTFAGASVKDSLLQTPTGGSIICNVPFETSLDSLAATFILSDTSTAYLVARLQTNGVSKNDFNNLLTYTIKAKDTLLTKIYTVEVIVNKNPECKLLTYGFASPAVSGTITQISNGGIVNVTVPFGTSIKNLIALFTISDSAKAYINSVKQNSNSSANDFTFQVVYKIIAQDASYSNTYTVNVIFGKSKSCDMLSYATKTPSALGTITPTGTTGGTIQVSLPFGTSLTNLIALFTVSDSAKVYIKKVVQQSGITINDFSSIVTYKLVAHDTNFSKTYLVTVSILPNTAADLITYSILNPAVTGTITPAAFGGYVTMTVPFATSVTNLVAQFTLSDSAKAFVKGIAQQSTVTQNDYTDTLIFVVTAQNKIASKKYLITVNKSPASASQITNGKLEIYPNPAINELRIGSNPVFKANTQFQICDVLGQIMMYSQLKASQSAIDISNLSAGIYYLKIFTDEGFVIGKFLKE